MLKGIKFADEVGDAEGHYEYGDNVKFECHSGYTVNARADGPRSFLIPCQKDGKFGAHDSCKPVECDRPQDRPFSTRSTSKKLIFQESVVYHCVTGYQIGAAASSSSQYSGVCGADGLLEWVVAGVAFSSAGGPVCEPVDCGDVPAPSNAVLVFSNVGGSARSSGGLRYGDPEVTVKCNDGFSLGGQPSGLTSFPISCKADGTFSGIEKTCSPVLYKVSGEATDAQDGGIKLGAKIEFLDQSGKVV